MIPEPNGAATGAPPAYLAWRRSRLRELCMERIRVIDYLCEEFSCERDFLSAFESDVSDAALILGSPRGGTSVVREILSKSDRALALPGEHRAIFTLLGLNYPDHGHVFEAENDRAPTEEEVSFLIRNLGYECEGRVLGEPSSRDRERFSYRLGLRARLQWPECDVAFEDLVKRIYDAVSDNGAGSEPVRWGELGLLALRDLLPVDLGLYDRERDAHAGISRANFPPKLILEISPFVLLSPCARPKLPVAGKVLLLKASSDAYRLRFLCRALSGWRIRALHLTRNPAASLNGLLDGWSDPCFWQHRLGPAAVDAPSALDPWCFDLYDGWQEDLRRPLMNVCAGQWLAPHRRILEWTETGAAAVTSARFEEFQHGDSARRAMIRRATRFLGLGGGVALEQALRQPRVVNASNRPAPGRWKSRHGLLRRVQVGDVADVAQRLGYDPRAAMRWP